MNPILTGTFDLQITVADILHVLKREPYLFCLDSSLSSKPGGRYSFIGFDPARVFQYPNTLSLKELEPVLNQFQIKQKDCLSPLPAGLVGLISYDYGLSQEKIPLRSTDDLRLPGFLFGVYDCMITFDHLLNKIYLTSTGLGENGELSRRKKAVSRLKMLTEKLQSVPARESVETEILDESVNLNLKSNFTQDQYCRMIAKALDYIAEGEIYQVNLAQRFHMSLQKDTLDTMELVKHLRLIAPSEFGGYFKAKDFEIISSSPERFLSLNGRRVQTRPMKGTRPRGQTLNEDNRFRNEMLESPKEKAELLMITDLERNDLGRVCEFGTVKVKQLRTIEEYSTVFQATSTVEGQLRKNQSPIDLIQACFPGGSVTGCPKIRAMQIIEELEPVRRSFYTGALGYFSFTGRMDFNVLIRTMIIKSEDVYYQVGGAIVADSSLQQEYQETLIKARAMHKALQAAVNHQKLIQKV